MATASNAEAFRFLSNVKRQSAPPRCHPFTIVLQVLALGMLFIGLTMTIIAHWPGASTIGENPLKIAGPVLLAVGGILFFIGVVAICCLNRNERTKWRKLVQTHIDSRNQSQAANRSQVSDKPIYDPQRGGAASSIPSDQGNLDLSQGGLRNGSDTGFYKGGRYANVGGDDQGDQSQFSSFDVSGQGDDVEFIAEPKRPQKKRRAVPVPAAAGAGSGLSDTSADHDQSGIGTSTMVTTTTTTTTTITKRTGEDGQTSEEKQTKTTKKTKHDAVGDDGRGGKSSSSAAAGRGGIQPPPSPGESKMLRVHVKAQPGASVLIHPSGSPSVQPRRAFSPSNTSGETDI